MLAVRPDNCSDNEKIQMLSLEIANKCKHKQPDPSFEWWRRTL